MSFRALRNVSRALTGFDVTMCAVHVAMDDISEVADMETFALLGQRCAKFADELLAAVAQGEF